MAVRPEQAVSRELVKLRQELAEANTRLDVAREWAKKSIEERNSLQERLEEAEDTIETLKDRLSSAASVVEDLLQEMECGIIDEDSIGSRAVDARFDLDGYLELDGSCFQDANDIIAAIDRAARSGQK
ncbi:hypothetical protein [Mongoliimonas terrestris]|uniref:hypothetical protein n=1 Tax=Mongoliimonas terrestris TaxID=1709001 RepID=UPI0011152827|nr:hypothetical protein [Mongoliimonas terrestris]